MKRILIDTDVILDFFFVSVRPTHLDSYCMMT